MLSIDPDVESLQVARERDPDSKRVRFKPNSIHRRSCCNGVNVRWLASGFILGMLVFATLSVLQVTCAFYTGSNTFETQACAESPVAVSPMLAFEGFVIKFKRINGEYPSAQGDAGQWALLSKHTETQQAGSSATQDDEVIPNLQL